MTVGEIVLASGSPTRAAMLQNAGLSVTVDPPAVDESEVKSALKADGAAAGDVAETLAELKATRVSRKHPGALVVGADQMLQCGDVWFDKPPDRNHARAQLVALRGRTHMLVSSAVGVRDGARLWHHTDQAHLTMRPFSDGFLDAYLDQCDTDVLGSVGAYRLEGAGAQLFHKVEGDYFTVLGLPLLPLLEWLRAQGILDS